MVDRRYIFVTTDLAHVAAVIRAHGWVSRKRAQEQQTMSTADAAQAWAAKGVKQTILARCEVEKRA